MTDTAEQTPLHGDEEDPFASVGNGAFLFVGLIIGFLAAAAVGMVVLIALDPLGPGGQRTATASPTTTVASGGGGNVSGEAESGAAVYASTCATCHGADGLGVTGLGPALVGNEFVQSKTDAELIAFINQGRDASHPDNTTGIAMPPKGGNQSLTDEDVADIVAHLRTWQ